MAPTYRSPPKSRRVALQTICTRELVMDMVNPDRPSPMILSTRLRSSFMALRLSFRIVLGPVRNRIIQAAERNWEMMVARAAPCTPM